MDVSAMIGSQKPGTYLMVGGKSLSLTDASQWGDVFGSTRPSVRTMAQQIGWVWIALQKRREGLGEIDYEWQRNGDMTERLPFVWDVERDLPRIDTALQTYGVAYLRKQRNGSGRFIGLRWLDPANVRPDVNTAQVVAGDAVYGWYIYSTGSRPADTETIPREDLIILQQRGLAEVAPMSSAVQATRLAAEVMRGIAETQETIFDNNALPPVIVKVPPMLQQRDVERIQSRFGAFFNRRQRTRERPVAGVHQDVQIETIPLNISDMAMDGLAEQKVDEILAAHGVPKSVAVSNAATYATALSDLSRFIWTLGSRFKMVANIINRDDDIARFGVELVPMVDRHFSQKRDEQAASTALMNYVNAGMSAPAATWLVLGMEPDDFPEWLEVVWEERQTPMLGGFATNATNDDGAPLSAEEQKSAAPDELARFKRWYHKRLGADVNEFKSDVLSHAEKVVAADDVLRAAVAMYP